VLRLTGSDDAKGEDSSSSEDKGLLFDWFIRLSRVVVTTRQIKNATTTPVGWLMVMDLQHHSKKK